MKLENKLKNKQFKQQSTIKKYRKEQRKLRQAVKDAVSKKPIPLEDPKSKRPGNESVHLRWNVLHGSDLFSSVHLSCVQILVGLGKVFYALPQ